MQKLYNSSKITSSFVHTFCFKKKLSSKIKIKIDVISILKPKIGKSLLKPMEDVKKLNKEPNQHSSPDAALR